MRILGQVCFFAFVLVAPALAQSRMQTEPAPAVAGPACDVSVGYTYLSMPIPSSKPVNLNGLDVSGHVDFNSRWGLAIDTNYVGTPNLPGIRHSGYLLSLLAGPEFYPLELRNARMFVHVLAGAGLVDGAVPVNDLNFIHGWLIRPSYAVGAGAEHSVVGPFALRIAGDYLRTSFYDATNAVHPQNNLRATVSLVIRLKQRPQSRLRGF